MNLANDRETDMYEKNTKYWKAENMCALFVGNLT